MTEKVSSKILVGVIILSGIVSGFSLYWGIQAYGSNDLFIALMCIGAGVGGFTFTGYRAFKLLKNSKSEKSSDKEVFTTIECNQCEEKTERPFMRGDYIYKNTGACSACSGQLIITKIVTPEETPLKKVNWTVSPLVEAVIL